MIKCLACNHEMTPFTNPASGVTYNTNVVEYHPVLGIKLLFYKCDKCGYLAEFEYKGT